MATGVVIAGTTALRNDGGSIAVPPGTSFTSTRWDESTELFGAGIGVATTPKTGLATIDLINAAAGATALGSTGIIAKVNTILGGIANTTMQKMDKGVHLQTPKRDDASGINTATAIRAGFWHEYSGVFTTAPESQNSAWGTDFSSVSTGNVGSSVGAFRFMSGRQDPSGANYPGRTQW